MNSSPVNPAGPQGYRFGPFEVRVRSGMLLRDGQRARIQELPFRMLVVLIENTGEVVTREELRNRLWSQTTFGEFDNSLRVAAAKLRDTLGDSAAEPQFIKTISGRGYQFIGEVMPIVDPAIAENVPVQIPEDASQTGPQPISIRRTATLPPDISERTHFRTGRPLRMLAVCIFALPVLAGLGFLLHWYQNRPLAKEGDLIAVAGVANHTGESTFDNMLSEALRIKLDESPYLTLVPDRQFRQAVKDMQAASLGNDLSGCAKVGAKILLRGEIVSRAPGYQVRLGAWRCDSRRLLTTQQAGAASKTEILPALQAVSDGMRRRLGEPASSLAKFDVPLQQATTGSLAALEAFTRGDQKHLKGMEQESIADYKIAVDLDPQFALGYARLGTMYSNAGERALARQYFSKAFELRDRTTDRERLYIAAHYYLFGTGDIQRAIETYQLWSTLYPRDWVWPNNLATIYMTMGKPEKAIDLIWTAIHLNPAPNLSYANLALAYLRSGDYSKLNSLCSSPPSFGADIEAFRNACYLLAFAQDDRVGEDRHLQTALKNPADNISVLDDAATIALYRGQVVDSRRLFSLAKDAAIQENAKELAALVTFDQADMEAELGFAASAKQKAEEALALSPASPEGRAFAALAFARSRELDRAEAEVAKAASEVPTDTILNSAELASVRAVIQLERKNPQAALRHLEETRPYDYCPSMRLAPAYFRGLAYMENHQPALAISEFQGVLDHRAIAPNSIYVALARLELAHAQQMVGNWRGAEATYQKVDDTWKNADRDFPPLKQLRAYRDERAVAR